MYHPEYCTHLQKCFLPIVLSCFSPYNGEIDLWTLPFLCNGSMECRGRHLPSFYTQVTYETPPWAFTHTSYLLVRPNWLPTHSFFENYRIAFFCSTLDHYGSALVHAVPLSGNSQILAFRVLYWQKLPISPCSEWNGSVTACTCWTAPCLLEEYWKYHLGSSGLARFIHAWQSVHSVPVSLEIVPGVWWDPAEIRFIYW